MARKQPRSHGLDAFWAAQKRIGVSATARTGWLLTFANREESFETRQLAIGPEQETEAVRWEALAFSKGPFSKRNGFITVAEDELPSWSEITRAHRHLWIVVLGQLRQRQPADVEANWRGTLTINADGRVTALALTSELPFRSGFLLQAYEALAGLTAERRRLRFCLKCERPFVARGRQAYDLASCSLVDRTARYRDRHRDAFREYRRTYYRRKVAEKLGRPVEKIKFRSREGRKS
jgi:hypothetical protein